tara:strand:- start:671 stop:1372 length:702 start_codon:yes stop_codon:yes gene_type:complete
MVSGPKASEYAPGPDEKRLAAEGKNDLDFFQNSGMQDLLVRQIQEVSKTNRASTVRGFRSADIAQTLQNDINLQLARSFADTTMQTIVSAKETIKANSDALNAGIQEKQTALANAYGFSGNATNALTTAAKIDNLGTLSDAKAIQSERLARNKMVFEGAKAAGTFGISMLGKRNAARAITGDDTLGFGNYNFTPGQGGGINVSKGSLFGPTTFFGEKDGTRGFGSYADRIRFG